MPSRKKIWIIEHDDFLRELLGNLLHKKGFYILNGYSIAEGIAEAQKHHVDIVILDTSSQEFRGKETLHYLNKELPQTPVPDFYIINETGKILDFVPEERQYPIASLSVQKILHDIVSSS